MKNLARGNRTGPIVCLTLILGLSTAHAGKNLLKVEAEASPRFAPRGTAVFTDCFFGNVSHMNTVESTISVFVLFSDGNRVTLIDSEPLVLAPGDAQIIRGAVVVDDTSALGTAVLVCRAESTIVGGPRPDGQGGVDSDAATFEIFDYTPPGEQDR